MFWTTGAVLAALTLSQVLAGVVKPEVFSEDAITEVLAANSRIAFGWEAYPGQFPYVAALRVVNPGGGVSRCVGSVVHRNWILTSARCVANRISVVVSAGVTDLTAEPMYVSEDTESWIHPTYVYITAHNQDQNNIALVKLQQPLVYSTLVQPIRIQPSAEAFANFDNEVLVTCGWGRLQQNGDFPEVLNWVYLRGMTNAECGRTMLHVTATSTHICATSYNDTLQAICYGDVGGPLVHTDREGEPLLVGVTAFWSATAQGCAGGRPNGFIRPGAFHSWLTEVTGLDFENLEKEDEVTETPEPPTTEITEPPTTEITEPPTTEVTEPPTTEVTEPPTTEVTEPPTTEVTEPPTTEVTEPPTTEITEPPTTEITEPPTTEVTEPPTTEVTEPPTTEVTEPPTTEVTEPPANEVTEPTTTEITEPPITEITEPPTTEVTEPPATEVTEPSTTEATEPSTVVVTEPDSEESGQNSNESDSSEWKEDPDIPQLAKKLQVKMVKVSKNKVNNIQNSYVNINS